MNKLKLALVTAGLLTLGGITVWSIVFVLGTQRRTQAVALVRRSISAGEYSDALKEATELLDGAPDWTEARWLAARSAFGAGRRDRAMSLLAPLFKAGDDEAAGEQVMGIARSLLEEGRIKDGEAILRRAAGMRCISTQAMQMLVDIYVAEGRWDAARRCIFQLLAREECRVDDLLFLVDPAEKPPSPRQRRLTDAAQPHPILDLARARQAIARSDWPTARTLLANVLALYPHLRCAEGLYGRALVETGDWKALDEWSEVVASRDVNHPDAWIALARAAETHQRPERAARAYWEALRRRTDDIEALDRLADILEDLDPEASKAYRERARSVSKLAKTGRRVGRESDRDPPLRGMALLCESMGRYWEAWAWQSEVAERDPTNVTAKEALRRLRSRLADDLPPVVERLDVSLRYRCDRYPLPITATTVPVSARP